MRIQHNIMAMNAYRNYNTNTKALSGNLEKLSSGYKINRAGDDAAGLAISEKMRAQITGLDAAQKNVKDGISLVKTAEGAMQEIQDMLNRMDYLATQSANGTYQNEVDRENLQKEVEALKTEINRIADSANFNGINLLDGSVEAREAADAYTTTEEVKGALYTGNDRVLSSVIRDGEKAIDVAGKKTILDTSVGTAQKAKMEVDLKGLSFDFSGIATVGGKYASGTIAASTLGLDKFKVSIGGQEFGIKASAIKVTITASGTVKVSSSGANGVASASFKATGTAAAGSAVAKVLTKALLQSAAGKASATRASVKINDVKWAMKASGSKLKFEQINKPENANQANANFDVKVGFTGPTGTLASTAGNNVKVSLSGSIDPGTAVTQVGVPLDGANKANTIFKITADDIRDGAKIKLGDRELTLKVGPDSTVKTTGSTVVDLSDMRTDKIDINKALSAISKAMGTSVTFSKNTASGGTVSITLEVGVSDEKSENFTTGLTIQRTDSNAAYFKKLSDFDDIFKLDIPDTKITHEYEAVEAQAGLTLQIGDTADKFNQMEVSIGDMHVNAMGTRDDRGNVTSSIEDININTQAGAQAAVQTIKDAINYVSSVRGDLGAIQNRLEHTGNNLSVMAENIQDAESTIRDTDVADEMMKYVKNNILVQSAQAMLAQANQVPQGVLQLLG